jgi:YggT family protein
LAYVLCRILQFYTYVLFARVIISFVFLFRPDWRPTGPIKAVVDVIYGLTEPPLAFIRKYVPQPSNFPLDLGFVVLYLIVGVVLPRIICG